MIFTNQALALFPPALGQAIAHTQRDRQELVEEICCRIGQVPVLLTQAHAYPAECRAILAGDLDYLLERATGASVYAAGEQIRQGYLQTAGGCRVGLCGCAYGQAAGQIDGIRQLSSVSVRIPHAVPGCADALLQREDDAAARVCALPVRYGHAHLTHGRARRDRGRAEPRAAV